MSDANETRGEISLELGGTDYVLRPSYQAIQAIERKTGKGLLALARLAGEGELTLADTAMIAAECIRAYGNAIDDKMLAASSPEGIAEKVIEAENGIAGAMATVAVMLGLAATGGYTTSGELKPAKVDQQASI